MKIDQAIQYLETYKKQYGNTSEKTNKRGCGIDEIVEFIEWGV